MAIELNHTILATRDPRETAAFYSEVLGLPESESYGPFLVLRLSNSVSLDILREDGEVTSQHYAFLVTEGEFDEIFARLQGRGQQYWADPFHEEPGRVNNWYGGRGVYFLDPSGHRLEIMTRPYGSS